MVTPERKPMTPSEMRQARIAELDAVAQIAFADQQRRLEAKTKAEAFAAAAELARQAREAAMEAGTYEPPPIPTLVGEFTRIDVENQQAELEAKRAQVREQRENPFHWVHTLPKAPQWHEAWKQAKFAREAKELGIE